MNDQALHDWLRRQSALQTDTLSSSAPLLISMDQPDGAEQLDQLRRVHPDTVVIEHYDDMLEELYFCRNPKRKFQVPTVKGLPEFEQFIQQLFGNTPLWQTGSWAYYPWNHKLIHVLPQSLHQELRTNRNAGLIGHEEQHEFENLAVGIAGLSVGQSVALTSVLVGGCRRLHLADFDTISMTNSNRIHMSLEALSLNKAEYTGRLIYELDPYAEIQLFQSGIDTDTLPRFFDGLDVVVDEIDHFPSKLVLRQEASRRRIPIIMVTEVADAVVLDVERYDIDPTCQPFNGKANQADLDQVRLGAPNAQMVTDLFRCIVGDEYIPQKMLDIMPLLGQTLAGPPQLGSSAALAGVIASYALRRIATKQKLESGTCVVNLDTLIDPHISTTAVARESVYEHQAVS